MAKVLTEEPGRCQISLFDADWPRFIKSNAGLRKTSRLSAITAEINASESQNSSTESLAQRIILEKDADKRTELVNEYVAISVTEWTGISSPTETDLNKSLYSYGVDSTAALTLKMQLESNLQVSFEVRCLGYRNFPEIGSCSPPFRFKQYFSIDRINFESSIKDTITEYLEPPSSHSVK